MSKITKYPHSEHFAANPARLWCYADEAESVVRRLEEENDRLAEALHRIAKWARFEDKQEDLTTLPEPERTQAKRFHQGYDAARTWVLEVGIGDAALAQREKDRG